MRRPVHLAPSRRRPYLAATVALALAALLVPLATRIGRVGTAGAAGACSTWRVIDGNIPLSWTWEQAHANGTSGIRTTVASGPATVGCARLHDVEDGWRPREQPYPTNRGVMDAHDLYMTGIRDDAIEDDNFMPGTIRDSLLDGVYTFLSEQNQQNHGDWQGTTIGPGEDRFIHLDHVYVRLHRTNPDRGPGRWFKWQPRGVQSHRLEINNSVLAVDSEPRSWDIPPGTVWGDGNLILWLGGGTYPGPRPAGVPVLQGASALAKWDLVRNNWLVARGFPPRPAGDLNPMDDPVTAPGQ
jgi:hypothetical protein